MLVTFHSSAAPDVVMLRDLAQYLLGLAGKHLDARGIIAHHELPHAIERIEAAVYEEARAELAHDALLPHSACYSHEPADDGLSQRAWPFLDMLREARKQNTDILWGG